LFAARKEKQKTKEGINMSLIIDYKATSPVTWGMEVEYSRYERPRIEEFFESPPVSWAEEHGEENDVIYEGGIGVSDKHMQFIRRACIIGALHSYDGYRLHNEGEDDAEAESNHLHIGLTPCPTPIWGQVANALAWGKQFTRNGYHHRDAIGKRGSFVDDSEDAWKDTIPYDSKGTWATRNALGTIEYRINGNPAPLFMALAAPMLLSLKAKPFEYSGVLEVAYVRECTDLARAHPSYDHNKDMLAKYGKDFGEASLENKIITMGLDDAAPYEVWDMAHAWLTDNSALYNTMRQRTGV